MIQQAMVALDDVAPDAINIAAMAKQLGVSQAAPYRHFADRDALLAAVALEGFKLFSEALVQGMAGHATEVTGQSGLSRIAHAYTAFGLHRPGLYRLMFATNLLCGPPAATELRAAAGLSFNLLVAALGPQGTPAQRNARAVRIWVGLHGVVMLAAQGLLEGGPSAGLSIEALVVSLLTD
jgi:AcrR family transcriptional regulator